MGLPSCGRAEPRRLRKNSASFFSRTGRSSVLSSSAPPPRPESSTARIRRCPSSRSARWIRTLAFPRSAARLSHARSLFFRTALHWSSCALSSSSSESRNWNVERAMRSASAISSCVHPSMTRGRSASGSTITFGRPGPAVILFRRAWVVATRFRGGFLVAGLGLVLELAINGLEEGPHGPVRKTPARICALH